MTLGIDRKRAYVEAWLHKAANDLTMACDHRFVWHEQVLDV